MEKEITVTLDTADVRKVLYALQHRQIDLQGKKLSTLADSYGELYACIRQDAIQSLRAQGVAQKDIEEFLDH